jgi:hypothetical protein
MKIDVTQEDIANGVREDGTSCPIALACERAGLYAPNVDNEIATDEGNYNMTAEAIRFIEDFDSGQPVKPFSFETELMVEEDVEEDPELDDSPKDTL